MNCKHENASVEIIINNTLENCVCNTCVLQKKKKTKNPCIQTFKLEFFL